VHSIGFIRNLSVATVVLLLHTLPSFAQNTIKIEFDTDHPDAQGQSSVGDPQFSSDDTNFSSRGWQGDPADTPPTTPGSRIQNRSHFTITDIHIKLINPDKYGKSYKFDPASTGGKAFPDVKPGPGVAQANVSPEITANGTEITFKGGNIKPKDWFWTLIPMSSDFRGGKGLYAGRLTPIHEDDFAQGGQNKKKTDGKCQTIYDNWNTLGVGNAGATPTFTVDKGQPNVLCYVQTYHWNIGSNPVGTIQLKSSGGQVIGPIQAQGSPGSLGRQNVDWTATPATPTPLPVGVYTIIDSGAATWSQNSSSQGFGFARVWVQPGGQ